MNRLASLGRLRRAPRIPRIAQWGAFSTSRSGGATYNVTDADIVSLAKKHQHPLSLADLVK